MISVKVEKPPNNLEKIIVGKWYSLKLGGKYWITTMVFCMQNNFLCEDGSVLNWEPEYWMYAPGPPKSY